MSRTPDRPVGFKYLYIPYDGQPHSPSGDAWDERGVIVAKCRQVEREKPPLAHCGVLPNESCGCGIYGGFDLSLCNESDGWSRVLFLVEGFGRSIVSVNGFRSELARITHIVRTPWCPVEYDKIAVYPRLPRISLDTAVAVIREHREQWLTLNEEVRRTASIMPPLAVRKQMKVAEAK